ncbi:hypothetical protein DM860_012331 [Cuscuta australis]|uniref:Reverse transcriptase zinc-binding domain-containing protein n=1 Tax=Cuscuta australis TaxID=267555 RepID=A0A328DQK0_9ASTE|nr:hypothetical protein DM860_012331 [Cuscuta australis]
MIENKQKQIPNSVWRSKSANQRGVTRYDRHEDGQTTIYISGSPITTSKLKKADCDTLINELTSRITTWGTRNLSYMARVRIINSILMGIISFWTRIFILPKQVIKRVMAMCRNFLWSSNHEYIKTPLVNWEEVCQEKKFVGLGIKNASNWNKATIMKLNWDVADKKDMVWVKWIHGRYIKGEDYWEHKLKQDACHYWREMTRVRDKFIMMPRGKPYSISDGYRWLQGSMEIAKWSGYIWNKSTPPKFKFVIWLLMKGRMQTKERLSKYIKLETDCVMWIGY